MKKYLIALIALTMVIVVDGQAASPANGLSSNEFPSFDSNGDLKHLASVLHSYTSRYVKSLAELKGSPQESAKLESTLVLLREMSLYGSGVEMRLRSVTADEWKTLAFVNFRRDDVMEILAAFRQACDLEIPSIAFKKVADGLKSDPKNASELLESHSLKLATLGVELHNSGGDRLAKLRESLAALKELTLIGAALEAAVVGMTGDEWKLLEKATGFKRAEADAAVSRYQAVLQVPIAGELSDLN